MSAILIVWRISATVVYYSKLLSKLPTTVSFFVSCLLAAPLSVFHLEPFWMSAPPLLRTVTKSSGLQKVLLDTKLLPDLCSPSSTKTSVLKYFNRSSHHLFHRHLRKKSSENTISHLPELYRFAFVAKVCVFRTFFERAHPKFHCCLSDALQSSQSLSLQPERLHY